MRKFTWGVECKLGYGLNEQFHRFVKVNGEPQEVKEEKVDGVEVNSLLPLANDQLISFYLGCYLEKPVLRVLDFGIINDEKKYWRFDLLVYTREETCEKVDIHPESCDLHVVGLEYGIYLNVIISQEHFAGDNAKTKTLLKSVLADIDKLSDIQKKEKCRVLINTKKEKEMTMEELFKFTNEFREGKYPELEDLIIADVKKHKELRQVEVKDEGCFIYFLTYLYTCYRKIGMKFEKTSYPLNKLSIPCSSSIKEIVMKLDKAKEAFKTMDTTDFFKMYPIMKELFWRYREYLEFSIDRNFDIDEGDDLPGTWSTIEPWLMKLNDWTPVEINGKWFGVENGQLLIVPIDCLSLTSRITSIEKYKSIKIEHDEEFIEPYLYYNDEINGKFGFVEMKRPFGRNTTQEISTPFKLICPLECSDDIRKWICSTCGDVIKGGVHLSCLCGIKLFDKEVFTCNHPEHELTLLTQKLPEDLGIIVQQLKKYEKDDAKDPKINQEIKESRIKIIREYQNMDLKEVIKKMKELNVFDGDTEHVFNQYLDKN